MSEQSGSSVQDGQLRPLATSTVATWSISDAILRRSEPTQVQSARRCEDGSAGKASVHAQEAGVFTIRVQAPEGRSLSALLAPQLRLLQLRLNTVNAAKDMAERA